MTRFILSSLFVFFLFLAHAQSYLGTVTQIVNFRSGPGTEFEKIKTIDAGSQVFIISLKTENDFYHILDIASDKEGYVHKSYVKVGEEVKESSEKLFTVSGKSTESSPQVNIFNNTELRLSLKVNNSIYSIEPYARRSITLAAGRFPFRASAPGVIPLIGTETFESSYIYEWEFFIVTR
jgi:hypothetical protein